MPGYGISVFELVPICEAENAFLIGMIIQILLLP